MTTTNVTAANVVSKAGKRASPCLADFFDLWLLRLAKWRRKNLSHAHKETYKEFYENFFKTRELSTWQNDCRMSLRGETIGAYFLRNLALGSKILDVGCGLGDVLADLPKEYQLHGIDYAAYNVDIAQSRLGPMAMISQGSIYELPFADQSIDACICLEVLEHIEDDVRGVSEIARVLRPGGVLVASVPYTYYWPDYLRLMGHFRHYTRQSFSVFLEQHGLISKDYLPNYPNWHRAYTWHYAMIQVQIALFGPLLGRPPVHLFKLPWQKKPALEMLRKKLEWLRKKDEKLDYARLDTSTLVAAYKVS